MITERRDVAIDEPPVHGGERRVSKIDVVERSAAGRIDDRVHHSGQAEKSFATVHGAEVERDAELAEVVVPEVQALAAARNLIEEGTVPWGRRATRRLHFDYFCTEPGEHLAAILAQLIGNLEDSHALKEPVGSLPRVSHLHHPLTLRYTTT